MYLHVKGQLDLCLQIAVVDFEEAMYEFPEINEITLAQIQDWKESLTNDAR